MKRTAFNIVETALRPLRGLGFRKFAFVRWVLGALKPRRAIVRGRTMFLDPTDFVVSEEISRGEYEQMETNTILKLVQPSDTIIDLGANIGYYTILFCDAARAGRVHAFEPAPQTFGFLQKNIQWNGLKNASLYQIAIGERDGEAELFINGFNKGDNRLYESFGTKGVPVRVSKLDSVIPPGTKVDLIKMDIQGFEVHALRGMQRILHENHDLYIVAECYPKGLRRTGTPVEDFFALLEDNGFSWCMMDDETGELRALSKEKFIERFPSNTDAYANLLLWRGKRLPKEIRRDL